MSGVLEQESMQELQEFCEPLEVIGHVEYMCIFMKKGTIIRFFKGV